MQRLIACSEDGFAFVNPDKTVLEKHAYLTADDSVSMRQIRAKSLLGGIGKSMIKIYQYVLSFCKHRDAITETEYFFGAYT